MVKAEAYMEDGGSSHINEQFRQCVICYIRACSKCRGSLD